jgi:4-amino-4-deoxy-L-arabinose transferase-like glycosyltransferase
MGKWIGKNRVLILILLLAAILRFYRFGEMVNFDFDQEYAADFAYDIVKVFPVTLIGQGLSVQGLFMGPWYFYFLVPFFFLTNLHPLGGFIGSVCLGLITIAAYYFLLKRIFNIKTAMLAAFLRSIMFVAIVHDWTMVPCYSSELLVLITWYIFYRYWQGETKLIPLLALIFGLFTSIHPILFPLYLVFLLLLIIKRKLPDLKTSLLSAILFLIPVSPLILFEFLHNFMEVKRLLSFFSTSPVGGGGENRIALYVNLLASDLANILGISPVHKYYLLFLISLILIFLILRGVGKWRESFHRFVLPLTFVTVVIYYQFFPTHIPEYYYLALTTLTFVYLCYLLSFLSKKKYLLPVLFLILVNIIQFNFRQLWEQKWNKNTLTGLAQKDFIVKEIISRQPPDQNFYISYISLPGWKSGFSYLFKYYNRIPSSTIEGLPVYTIVIPKFMSPDSINIYSGDVGLILPDNN